MTAEGRLRVLQIAPRYGASFGGVETHVKQLSKGLVEQGVSVEIATTGPSGLETQDGIIVRTFPSFAPADSYHFSPQLLRFVRRARRGYDVIHAHSYHSLTTLAAAVAADNTPLVVTPHYHAGGHTPFRRIAQSLYSPLGRWVMNRAAAIICVSQAERDLLLDLDGGLRPRCGYIPNGIDDSFLDRTGRPSAGEDGREEGLVLTVARLERYKRVDRLIEAFRYLPASFRLLIVGTGPDESNLKKLTQLQSLQSRVTFAGAVSNDELHSLYRRASVYASFSSREAFGLTLLEAIACGCPVVASDLPSHVELAAFAEGIAVVPSSSDPPILARAIAAQAGVSAHLRDPSALRWTNLAASTLETYRQVLSRRPLRIR